MKGSPSPLDLRRINADNKLDVRVELDRFEELLQDLKVNYEQYFSGVLPLAPDKLHQTVKRQIRILRKAPFKNSAQNYRLRMLEHRYSSYNTYWQRVLREREEGTYYKDVFKANLRETTAAAERNSDTQSAIAEKGVKNLFEAYRQALEKVSGRRQELDFDNFKQSILKRAQDFRAKNSGQSLKFKVVVRDGKVALQAKVRPAKGEAPQRKKPEDN